MKTIQLMNKISPVGTGVFDSAAYTLTDKSDSPDALLVRSASLHEMEFPSSLKAIARCGAGVNNIPLDRAGENGIVVFNTPGANSNAVKELAVCALMLASRNVIGGIEWAKTLKGTENVQKTVEKEKGRFAGIEVFGKTLGIIGLGAIGGKLANAAVSLGMKVVGCDPYLSVGAAHALCSSVEILPSFDDVFSVSDFISVHVPATPETKNLINSSTIAKMKDGVRILNLARADLVSAPDIKEDIRAGKVSSYVTDFPTEETVGEEGIVCIPHLGASTDEAEDNCASMASRLLIDYLENGNINCSVNYPSVSSPKKGVQRICILHDSSLDVPSQVFTLIDTPDKITKTKGKFGYTLLDMKTAVPESAITILRGIEGIYKINVL